MWGKHTHKMAHITIDDPDLYAEKEVDGSGRVYLGKNWAGKRVKIVIESAVEDEANEGTTDES